VPQTSASALTNSLPKAVLIRSRTISFMVLDITNLPRPPALRGTTCFLQTPPSPSRWPSSPPRPSLWRFGLRAPPSLVAALPHAALLESLAIPPSLEEDLGRNRNSSRTLGELLVRRSNE